jgi:hypothetical protein
LDHGARALGRVAAQQEGNRPAIFARCTRSQYRVTCAVCRHNQPARPRSNARRGVVMVARRAAKTIAFGLRVPERDQTATKKCHINAASTPVSAQATINRAMEEIMAASPFGTFLAEHGKCFPKRPRRSAFTEGRRAAVSCQRQRLGWDGKLTDRLFGLMRGCQKTKPWPLGRVPRGMS